MGNTPVNTSCRPSFRGRSGWVSVWRKSGKLFSSTSSRFGIWRFQSRSSFEKLFRSLRRGAVFKAFPPFSLGKQNTAGESAVARSPPVGVYREARSGHGLLDLDRRALLLELGLHVRGLGLGDLVLQGLGGAVHQVLRLLEAQTGQLAHHLDHLDLLVAGAHEDHVELRLLLGDGSA